jgi:hypothetical protein
MVVVQNVGKYLLKTTEQHRRRLESLSFIWKKDRAMGKSKVIHALNDHVSKNIQTQNH